MPVSTTPPLKTKEAILSGIQSAYPDLTPQLRKAAAYILNNPNDIGVRSMRQIAEHADVNPNTLVRLAQVLGFEGYNQLRQPFSDFLRHGIETFPDRARWLQSLGQGNGLAQLYGDMATRSLRNMERLFEENNADALKALADQIVAARHTFVLGVGVARAAAVEFSYLARMAIDSVEMIPRDSGLPVDDVTRIQPGDVLLAMTFSPFRRDVVEATRLAKARGAIIAAISDSRTAPIAFEADHIFVVPTETPHFFTSMVSVMALIETLIAFIVADAEADVIERIDAFHRARFATGVYIDETE